MTFVQSAILGLGLGGACAILSVGVAVIYRGNAGSVGENPMTSVFPPMLVGPLPVCWTI